VADVPRYRFGPLERRGVLAGLRGAQIAVVGVASVVAVAMLRLLPAGPAAVVTMSIALLAAFFAFVPIAGRTGDEWVPVLAGWLANSLSGTTLFISRRPSAGETLLLEDQPHFPPVLRDVVVLSHLVPSTAARIGVLKDRRDGTYTGVLSVRGKSFALLDAAEKTRRLSSWAGVLAGLAREGGVVHRVQWIERTVPDPGDEIGEYLKHNVAVALDSAIARSYLEVVDDAAPVTQEHEVFVALQVHAGKAGRAIKAAGGGDFGACEVLRRELTALSASLMGTDVVVDGALTPRLLAHALRAAFDPASRGGLASMGSKDRDRAGTSVANAGPMAAQETWSAYHSDGAWHATYWIAEWPRIDVDPDFLAPLLLRTEAMRAVSLIMEPVSPLKAIRSVEAARTSAAADEELRHRAGFVTTLGDHERALSQGHAFYRFAGFITVSASSKDELATACGEIEEAAGRSFLDIRKLCGEQARAFTYTLPLCRGFK
jgi:hypothetical protein